MSKNGIQALAPFSDPASGKPLEALSQVIQLCPQARILSKGHGPLICNKNTLSLSLYWGLLHIGMLFISPLNQIYQKIYRRSHEGKNYLIHPPHMEVWWLQHAVARREPNREQSSLALHTEVAITAIFITIGPRNYFTLMGFLSTSMMRDIRQTLRASRLSSVALRFASDQAIVPNKP